MPRIAPAEYLALPLRVHTLLADVPLHDVWAVDMPRVRDGITLRELQNLLRRTPVIGRLSLPARALFHVRFFVGRILRLEEQPQGAGEAAFTRRLTAEDCFQSHAAPGTPEGLFRVVYDFEHERLLEVHNRTVHAALLTALAPTASGYRFYLAVYVCDTGLLTRAYMALIDPFRRWIIYPDMLKRIRAIWRELGED